MIKESELVSDFAFQEDRKSLTDFERAREFLAARARAYQQVFSAATPAGYTVLQDIAWFCRANRSTFDPNPAIAAGLNGQREVWLRINQHLILSADELARIYQGGQGR